MPQFIPFVHKSSKQFGFSFTYDDIHSATPLFFFSEEDESLSIVSVVWTILLCLWTMMLWSCVLVVVLEFVF